MRFQQPRYACFTSLAFSSMLLVKKASLQGWRGGDGWQGQGEDM
jgi:hypothetical protein